MNGRGTDSSNRKHTLINCNDDHMSAGVARMAFIEAAKEADIYIDAPGRPQPTGKLEKRRMGWMQRRA
jgi:hypothetical protein